MYTSGFYKRHRSNNNLNSDNEKKLCIFNDDSDYSMKEPIQFSTNMEPIKSDIDPVKSDDGLDISKPYLIKALTSPVIEAKKNPVLSRVKSLDQAKSVEERYVDPDSAMLFLETKLKSLKVASYAPRTTSRRLGEIVEHKENKACVKYKEKSISYKR